MRFLLTFFSLLTLFGFSAESNLTEAEAVGKIRAVGGHAFLNVKTKRIGEINLNRNQNTNDETMAWVFCCQQITDLSLEETLVGDRGIARIAGMPKLEWLNLYRTLITDKATASIATLPELKHLPIGETEITDLGLIRILAMTKLEYLGLRGTAVTDAGLLEIAKLVNLKGLHLGQTSVTDVSLEKIRSLKKLERLWLHDTAVSVTAVRRLLENQPSLRELHLQRTKLKVTEVQTLRTQFPDCEIFYEKD